jgi:hypothetical protein
MRVSPGPAGTPPPLMTRQCSRRCQAKLRRRRKALIPVRKVSKCCCPGRCDRFGVTTYTFDDTINRFLDANAVRRPCSAYRNLALITGGDTADDWLHAGQALSASLLTAAVAGLTATVHSLAETAGVRAMLRSLAAPAGQPQILIHLAVD